MLQHCFFIYVFGAFQPEKVLCLTVGLQLTPYDTAKIKINIRKIDRNNNFDTIQNIKCDYNYLVYAAYSMH